MQSKPKICKKGTSKALGFKGCGELKYMHRYSLCVDCFKTWCLTTPEGKELIEKSRLTGKKKADKEKKSENRRKKEEVRQKSYYEKKLQDTINSIVRLIDIDKGCISCSHGWDGKWTRQRHAGHRLSIGAFPELRYNLLDNFVQCSICNNFKSGNEREYDKGLIKHYGESFYNEAASLKGKYGPLNLTKSELKHYIKRANEIKREILNGKDYTRKKINDLIGIYI